MKNRKHNFNKELFNLKLKKDVPFLTLKATLSRILNENYFLKLICI